MARKLSQKIDGLLPKDGRSTEWCCIIYPGQGGTLPDDWREYLDSFHNPWIESPVHNADMNADDTEKKEHIHIAFKFDSKKSFEQVTAITEYLNGTIPKIMVSPRGMIRYFVHMDNPEKAQYSVDDIICHCGAEIDKYFVPSAQLRYSMIADMMDYIDENNIVEIQDLMRYARNYNIEWFRLLCDNSTFVISSYIKSARHRVVAVNPDTGEVIHNVRE